MNLDSITLKLAETCPGSMRSALSSEITFVETFFVIVWAFAYSPALFPVSTSAFSHVISDPVVFNVVVIASVF